MAIGLHEWSPKFSYDSCRWRASPGDIFLVENIENSMGPLSLISEMTKRSGSAASTVIDDGPNRMAKRSYPSTIPSLVPRISP